MMTNTLGATLGGVLVQSSLVRRADAKDRSYTD